MGLLDRGTAYVNRTGKAVGGVSVIVTRSGVQYPLTAVPGNVDAETERLDQQVRIDWTERVYLVLVADWLAAGLSGVPQVGDRFTETIEGVSRTFEAMRRDVEPCYRYTDSSQTAYRIYTKPKAA